MRSSLPVPHRASVHAIGTPRRHSSGYERVRDLPRLLPLWPEELADDTLAGRRQLVWRLKNLLRHERQRGLAGHWSYDLARHRQLVIAYRAEAMAARMAAILQRPSAGTGPSNAQQSLVAPQT